MKFNIKKFTLIYVILLLGLFIAYKSVSLPAQDSADIEMQQSLILKIFSWIGWGFLLINLPGLILAKMFGLYVLKTIYVASAVLVNTLLIYAAEAIFRKVKEYCLPNRMSFKIGDRENNDDK